MWEIIKINFYERDENTKQPLGRSEVSEEAFSKATFIHIITGESARITFKA